MCLVNNYHVAAFLSMVLLAGCSSSTTSTSTGAGSGNNPPPSNSTPKNVAAASNGATASSTFSGNESFTIDEDTGTGSFWSGGANGDNVTVTFDAVYSISEIIVRTNNTNFNVQNSGSTLVSGIRVELSVDGVTYNEVAMALGYTAPHIQCSSTSLGSGRIACTLNSQVDAKYIRVGVTDDFSTTEIYEIEVTGV